MKLLAIDTSTEAMALAVADGDAEELLVAAGGAIASARVIDDALALLARRGLLLGDLDAIAYACGPGAFTGLRTACAVTQGFAYGAEKPVLAIDSLLIVAEDARRQGQAGDAAFECRVAMDARMQEAYVGTYRHDGARWQVLRAPALADLPALNALCLQQPVACLAGNAAAAYGERLQTGPARRVPQCIDRAAALLQLARAAWQRGETLPAAEALPLYLRDRVALTVAERARGEVL